MIKKAFIAGSLLLVTGLLLLFAFYSYPAAAGDSTVFIPVAINLEAGKGLVNGVHNFLYPAPLFPLVLSALMWEPSPHSAFVALGLLGAGNLVLCTTFFYRAATSERSKLSWFSAVLVVLSITGLATQFSHSSGRPEILASLLLLIGINTTLCWRKEWSATWLWVLYGILLSLMGATNPNGALLFALLVGALCALRYSYRDVAFKLLCVYGIPLAGIGVLMLVDPARVGGMVSTAYSVGIQLLGKFSWGSSDYSILSFYIFDPNAPFYGIVFLIALAWGAHLLYRHRQKIGSPGWFVLFSSLLLIATYLSAIQTPNRRYNLILFAPLFFAVNIYYLSHLAEHDFKYIRPVQGAYVLVLALTTTGFAHTVAMFPDYVQHGMSLEEARTAFHETGLLESDASLVLVTRSMWALTEKYDRLQYCPNLKVCDKKEDANWLVAQQQYSGGPIPQKRREAYTLVKDFFVHKKPTFLGLKLGNSMRGYSFALYRKNKVVKKASQNDFSPPP